MFNDNSKELDGWEKSFTMVLNSYGKYELIEQHSLVATCQFIYAKPIFKKDIKVTNKVDTKLGMLGTLGNKGGVVTTIKIYDSIFKFCSCHLAAGSKQKDMESRIQHLNQILEESFSNSDQKKEDFYFLSGDLNFRVNEPKDTVVQKIDQIRGYAKSGDITKKNSTLLSLLDKDELSECLALNHFLPFRETFIEFLPTYKMSRDYDTYQLASKKIRTPSWTDRILSYSKDESNIKFIKYDSLQVFGSDHRPVYLLCNCQVKKICERKYKG